MAGETQYFEGQNYIIDVGFRNSGEVKLLKICGKHFGIVEDVKYSGTWQTMLNRLTPISETKEPT